MPTVEERPEQAYVAIAGDVTMDTVPAIADRMPEVFGWLAGNGVTPAGPPFFKYDVLGPAGELRIEVGVPVDRPLAGDGDVVAGTLPGGRYATVAHVGHPRELQGVTRDLLEWAAAEGLTFDMRRSADGELWGARLEFYLTDPRAEPDMSKWETVLAFRVTPPTA